MKVQPDKRAASTPYNDSPGANKKAIVPNAEETMLLDGDFNNIGAGGEISGPWSAGSNWEIVGLPLTPGKYGLSHTPGSTDTVSQGNLGLIDGAYYQIQYNIVGRTAGTVTAELGGVSGTANSTDGAYTEVFFSASYSTDAVVFTPTSAFDGLLRVITVKPLDFGDHGIVGDGDFTSGTAWTLSGDAAIATGTLHQATPGSGVGTATQDVGAITGELYIVQFTIAGKTAGDVIVILDETVKGSFDPGNGTHDHIIVTNGTGFIYPVVAGDPGDITFVMGSDFDGTIDNVSIFSLSVGSPNILVDLTFDFGSDSDWTKESGWTIGSGVATCDGTDGARIYQDLNLVKGRFYLMQYDITARSAGSVTAELGGTAGNAQSAVGTFMEVIKVGGTDSTHATNVGFLSTDFNGSIDNVEVHQVLGIGADERRVFEDVNFSYDAAPTGGEIVIVGQGGILHQEAVGNKGPEALTFEKFFHAGKGDATVAVLQQAGAAVSGRLNATIR